MMTEFSFLAFLLNIGFFSNWVVKINLINAVNSRICIHIFEINTFKKCKNRYKKIDYWTIAALWSIHTATSLDTFHVNLIIYPYNSVILTIKHPSINHIHIKHFIHGKHPLSETCKICSVCTFIKLIYNVRHTWKHQKSNRYHISVSMSSDRVCFRFAAVQCVSTHTTLHAKLLLSSASNGPLSERWFSQEHHFCSVSMCFYLPLHLFLL